MDDLKSGEVVVLACAGVTQRIAPWGHSLSTAATARGADSCLIDGLVRKIRERRFPILHGGIGPLDTKGRARMMQRGVLMKYAGVAAASGDLVFGDADGAMVIPQARKHAVIEHAPAKVQGKNGARDALLLGKSLASVFQRQRFCDQSDPNARRVGP